MIIESFMHGFKKSFVKLFKKNQCFDHFERETPSRLNAGTTVSLFKHINKLIIKMIY